LGVEYVEALARTKNFAENVQERSFTAASQEERIRTILGKHNLRPDLVKGRKPMIADDSIVRANTSKILVDLFKKAGAAGVYFAAGYPPIKYPCFNGMDFQTESELIASAKNIPAIKKRIGVDWLFYLRSETLVQTAKAKLDSGICGACYNGAYPEKPFSPLV
jgi:amidophosphoribosyltransferase